jgi:hypothetical protein
MEEDSKSLNLILSMAGQTLWLERNISISLLLLEVLTIFVGITTLPIMATVRLEIRVLHHDECVNSFDLVLLCVENGMV